MADLDNSTAYTYKESLINDLIRLRRHDVGSVEEFVTRIILRMDATDTDNWTAASTYAHTTGPSSLPNASYPDG